MTTEPEGGRVLAIVPAAPAALTREEAAAIIGTLHTSCNLARAKLWRTRTLGQDERVRAAANYTRRMAAYALAYEALTGRPLCREDDR